LGAEGQAGLLGNEVGAYRICDAADERDGGEADDLGAEKRKGRDFLVVLEKVGPAHGAEDEGQIDAGDAESDFAPVSLGQLSAEHAEVEVELLAAPDKESYERGQDNQAQGQLILLQAFSVSIGTFILWARPGLGLFHNEVRWLICEIRLSILEWLFAGAEAR